MLTDWFKPPLTPEHVGWYDAHFFDCGWPYEWRIWWNGLQWLDKPDGNSLIEQNQTWRGQTEQTA